MFFEWNAYFAGKITAEKKKQKEIYLHTSWIDEGGKRMERFGKNSVEISRMVSVLATKKILGDL